MYKKIRESIKQDQRGASHQLLVAILLVTSFASFGAWRVFNSQAASSQYAISIASEAGCDLAGRTYDPNDKSENKCQSKCQKADVVFVKYDSNAKRPAYCKGYIATDIEQTRCIEQLHRVYINNLGCARKANQNSSNNSKYCPDKLFPNYIAEGSTDRCIADKIVTTPQSQSSNSSPNAVVTNHDQIDEANCTLLGRKTQSQSSCERSCTAESGTLLQDTKTKILYCQNAVSTNLSEERCGSLNRRWIKVGCARRAAQTDINNAIQCLPGFPYYNTDYATDKRQTLTDVCEKDKVTSLANEASGQLGGVQITQDSSADQNNTQNVCLNLHEKTRLESCPEGTPVEQNTQNDNQPLDISIDKDTCILLGRVWVPKAANSQAGCSKYACSDKTKKTIENNSSTYCQGHAQKISYDTCDKLHRAWVTQVNVCISFPGTRKSGKTIVASKLCKEPYTTYVIHLELEGPDECLKPTTVEKFRMIAQASGKPFTYIAALPAKGVCKLQSGKIWQDNKCINRPISRERKSTTATFSFQNLGREEASSQAVFKTIKDALWQRDNIFFNFAEIDGADTGEHTALNNVFGDDGWSGFNTQVPSLKKLDKNWKRVSTEIVELHEATGNNTGPARILVVSRFEQVDNPNTKLAVINTHFVANAYAGNRNQRLQPYWDKAWDKLTQKVSNLHEANYDVVLTGDLNRPSDLPTLHPQAKTITKKGPDIIIAVPAPDRKISNATEGVVNTPSGEEFHKNIWAKITFENK